MSQLAADAKANDYPDDVSVTLVGSCTNSSYEDISRAAKVADQARAHGAKAVVPLIINPGSAQVYETTRRDGQLASLEAIGAKIMANACGPCIGQWKRDEYKKGERCVHRRRGAAGCRHMRRCRGKGNCSCGDVHAHGKQAVRPEVL